MSITAKVVPSPFKEERPDEDYRDKTQYTITNTSSSGKKMNVIRNCNHAGNCTEKCNYVYIEVISWDDSHAYIGLGTNEIQEFIAAFLAIREEAGLE